MHFIEAFLATSSWWRMPYRFATANDRDAFLMTLRQRNTDRCFRAA